MTTYPGPPPQWPMVDNADLRAMVLPGSAETVDSALNFIKGALNMGNPWGPFIDGCCDYWLTTAKPASANELGAQLARILAAHTAMTSPGKFNSEDEQYGAIAYELDHAGQSVVDGSIHFSGSPVDGVAFSTGTGSLSVPYENAVAFWIRITGMVSPLVLTEPPVTSPQKVVMVLTAGTANR